MAVVNPDRLRLLAQFGLAPNSMISDIHLEILEGTIPLELFPNDAPKFLRTPQLDFHSTMRSLRDTINSDPGALLVLYSNEGIGLGNGYLGFQFVRGGEPVKVAVITIKNNIVFREREYDVLLLVSGPIQYHSSITIHNFMYKANTTSYPDAALVRIEAIKNAVPATGQVATKDIIVYGVNTGDLYPIMMDINIPLETRILTIAFALFPHVREHIMSNYAVLPEHQLSEEHTRILLNWEQDTTDQKSNIFLGLVIIHMLGPSYTIDVKLAIQLAGRAAALGASSNTPVPSETDFIHLIGQINWTCKTSSPDITEIMGRIIAINEHGEHDPNITLQTIMSLEEYTNNYQVPTWILYLLVQMRMVYKGKHLTSLAFGISYIEDAKNLFGNLPGVWQTELKSLTDISATVTTAPYMALVRATTEKYHLSIMSRIVLFGVWMYERSLDTAKEREDFAMYNVESISSHINPRSDITIVRSFVRAAPHPQVTQLATILRTVNLEYGRNIMSGRTEEEIAQVISLLSMEPNPGAWYQLKLEIQKSNQKVKILSIVKEHVNLVIEEIRDRLETCLEVDMTAADRKTLKLKVNKQISMLKTLGQEKKGLEEIVPPSENATLQTSRTSFIEELQKNLDKIVAEANNTLQEAEERNDDL